MGYNAEVVTGTYRYRTLTLAFGAAVLGGFACKASDSTGLEKQTQTDGAVPQASASATDSGADMAQSSDARDVLQPVDSSIVDARAMTDARRAVDSSSVVDSGTLTGDSGGVNVADAGVSFDGASAARGTDSGSDAQAGACTDGACEAGGAGCRFPALGIEELARSGEQYLLHSFLDLGETTRQLASALDYISDAVSSGTNSACAVSNPDGSVQIQGCGDIIAGTFTALSTTAADGSVQKAYAIDVIYPWRHDALDSVPHKDFLVRIVGEFGIRTASDVYSSRIEVYAPSSTSRLTFSDPSTTLAFTATDFSFVSTLAWEYAGTDETHENVLVYTDETSGNQLTVSARYFDGFVGGPTTRIHVSVPYLSIQDGATRLFIQPPDSPFGELNLCLEVNGGITECGMEYWSLYDPSPACPRACVEDDTAVVSCNRDGGGAYTQQCIYGNWRSTTSCSGP